jgi:hypothetical protein
VAVADLNGDMILDVVIAHSEKPGYPLSWYSVDSVAKLNNGGRWDRHTITEAYDWYQTLDAGDIDNDGDVDLVAGKFARKPGGNPENEPPFPVTVFYNQAGDGSAWRPVVLSEEGVYSGVLGDVGSDGDLDLVGPRSHWTGPLRMWESRRADDKWPLTQWTYIEVDSSRTRYDGKTRGGGGWFGQAAGDLNGDGYLDIASGKWIYRNPGGDLTGAWERATLPKVVDAVLVVDVDDDADADVIALRCNEQYWFEQQGGVWEGRQVGSLPVCNHNTGSQGYALAQLVSGGKPEVLLTGAGIYFLEIPDYPEYGEWPSAAISSDRSIGEEAAAGDIDGDGDLDVSAAYVEDPENNAGFGVAWWRNPSVGGGGWMRHDVGAIRFRGDRHRVADLNGDAQPDIIVTEERYPGPDPDASLYWFEAPADPTRGLWRRHTVVTEYSLNNLDAADLDRDGDVDLVTCEHKGPAERLQIFENDGQGGFTRHDIDRGKESHLGARLADFDGDGDLDIFSIAWEDYQYLHLWRNDAR